MTTRPLTLRAGTGEVFYPETDLMPLPDGFEQGPHYREIVTILEYRFKDARTMVCGNSLIYYVEGDPSKRFAPDCYITFDIDKTSIKKHNTYLIWEVGKPPDFALEIGSRSTVIADIGPKRKLYAELGIGEYWRYDPTGGDYYGERLVGERLVDGEYIRFETRREPGGSTWGHSPTLNLYLHWTEDRLRFYDPEAGKWLRSYRESADRTAAARARYQAEDRAEAEAVARRLAGDRAAQVEAEIQELRRRIQVLEDGGR